MPPVSVVLHTATRVIRRMTTDLAPPIETDEIAVQLPDAIDIGSVDNGDGTRTFWKLDASNQKVAASDAEVAAADVDPQRVELARRAALLRVNQAIDAVAADNRNTATVREWAAAMQALRRFR